MNRILVTGVDGFTGRYLTSLLANQGDEVLGISHNPVSKPVDGLAASRVCDLTDAQSLRTIIADLRPNKIAHLAAIAFVSHGVVEDIYRTNVVGSRNLLEAASLVGGIDAVLLASSANIYGNRVSGMIDENVAPDPVNDYAVSKLSMEFVAGLYRDRLPLIIARPFNYTGIGQSTDFFIPKIINHVKCKSSKIELGNLDVARDFSDVRDVVMTYASLLSEPKAIGQTFNICSGKAHSLGDLITTIQDISNFRFSIEINPAFVRENEVRMLWGDRSKLDATIARQPMRELHETLTWMLGEN